MPDPNHLPEHLRARLVRGLDAVPERRPLPEQALYARAVRRRPGRRPGMTLASGAAAVVALVVMAGFASTGSADPVRWTGRALSAIRQDAAPASTAPPTPQPPAVTARPPSSPQHQPPPASPAQAPSGPGERGHPQAWSWPWPWLDGPKLPRFTPAPFPTPFPFPTPSGGSDFGRAGR